MTKLCSSNAIDAALTYLKTNAQKYHVCSAAPANYAGIAAVTLGNKAITSSAFGSPQAGDVSGRKITKLAESGIPIGSSGSATHVAIADDTHSDLLYVTEISNAQAVVAGNTANIGSWDVEIRAPA